MIAIDAQISPGEAGGSETHVPLHLAAMARRREEPYLVIGSVDHTEALNPLLGDNMRSLTYPVRYTWFKPAPPLPSAAANDALLKAHGVRAVHFPYVQHFPTDLPFIYEPWGLPHRHFPEMFQAGEPAWMDDLMRDGCERAAYVLVATRWAKRDIVAQYGLNPARVAVVSRNPMEGRPHRSRASAPLGLPRHFAYMPGALWPHKNHLGMIRALALVRDRHRVKVHVICTGKLETTALPAIREALKAYDLEDQVHLLGPIPRDQVEALFSKARILLHPSKFEGLGLPLVEAMHFGLPIVASNATCIPEVVGDAALLFDPEDDEAMAAAILSAWRSESLRTALATSGRDWLQTAFPTVDELGERFRALYQAALGETLSPREAGLVAEMTAA